MPFGVDDLYESGYENGYKDAYNKGYDQGFKDGKECTLVSIDAIEDIIDRMISIISEMDWEKLLKIDNTPTVERPQGDLISRMWLKEHKFTTQVCNGLEIEDVNVVAVATIDNAPTVEPKLSDEQIEKITDLLETEWGYEGIREDVKRVLRGGRE